jgi:hypothetical protein
MQLRTPSIGEVEEVGKRAVEAGEAFLATGTLEDLDASIAASKEFSTALAERFGPVFNDLEEKEAFDEHYDFKPVDEWEDAEADPWVEEREAAAADLQADAAAREIEAQS